MYRIWGGYPINKLLNISLIENKFIKFLIVGGINTLFGYLVYALLIMLNLHYSIAVLFATILGILFNFKTTGKLIFNNDNNRLILKFVGVYAATYVINLTFLKIFEFFKVNMFLAGAILLFPMALITFVLNKKFVFVKEQETQ